jgi:hypothetical protein
MSNFRLPLSGNVSQAINPWNWFQNLFGDQFGFINIDLGKSSDPDLEAQILSDVGSYGRQIGQITDALQVLLRHVPLEKLNADERRALQAFRYQAEEIERIKQKRQPLLASAVLATGQSPAARPSRSAG